MKYTIDFAESDSKLISYNQDIDISSSAVFGVLNKLDNEILSAVIINNFKTRRMINFAESALKVEFEVLSDQKFTQHSSLDSNIDSISTYNNENKDVEINNLENINKCSRVSFWDSLPQTLSVKNIPNIGSNTSSFSSDNSIKQLQRDIQRDQILINGQLLIGADVGLEGTMEILEKTIDNLLEECDIPSIEYLAPIQPSLKQNFCYAILHTACRTNSGGVSYSGLQVVLSQNKNGSKRDNNDKNKSDKNSPADEDKNKLSSHDKSKENRVNTSDNYNDNSNNNGNDGEEEDILSKYIIVPQSTLAPPLRIRLSVCKFGIDDDVMLADKDRDSVKKTTTTAPSSSSDGSAFMSLFRKRVAVANKKKTAATPNNKSNKTKNNSNKIVTLTPDEEGILQQHILKSTSSLSVAQVQQAVPSTSSSVNIGDGISGKTSVSNVAFINSGGNSNIQDGRIPATATTTTTTVLPSVLSINNKSLLSKPLLSSLPLSTSLIKNNSCYINSNNNDTTICSWGIRCSIDCITIFSLKPIDGGYDSSRRGEGVIKSSIAANNNDIMNAIDSDCNNNNNTSSDNHSNRNLQVTYHNSVVLPLNIVSKKLTANTTQIENNNGQLTATAVVVVPVCEHIVNNGQVQVSIYNATDSINSGI